MASYADQIADLRKRRQKAPQKGANPLRPANQSATKEGRVPARRPSTPSRPKRPVAPAVDPRDPAEITGPLTPEQLDREAAAAVRTRFGGTEKEIQGQQRVSDQMQTNVGSWFDQYKADVEASRQRTAAFNQGVQATQAQQAQQAQAVDTAAAATPEAQQAAAARRSTSDSFGSMLASQASAQNAYQADQGRIGSGEQQHQRVAEAGRAKSLADALVDLVGQKGDFETQYRSQARESERKRELETKAFDLDSTKAQADVELKAAAQRSLDSDRASDNKRQKSKDKQDKMKDDRQYRLDKTKVGAAQAKDNYQREHGLGPYKPASSKSDGPSRADRRAERTRVGKVREKSGTALGKIDDAKSAWDDLKATPYATGRKDKDGHDVLGKGGAPETRKATDAEVRAEMRRQGFSANEIHLALAPKPWGKQEVAMAHRLGIRVPRSYLPLGKDPKPTGGQQNGLGGK